MALLPGMRDLLSVISLTLKVVEDEVCEFELLEDYGKNNLKFLTRE